MDIRVLQYFLAVAREESITKAAEALNMTQPPLSRQLRDLEEELGKKLLIRGNKRVTLTEEGMLLRKRAEEMVDLMEKTRAEITCSDETITGDIHIGSGEADAIAFLAQAAKSLQRQYPLIRYRIYSGDADHVMEKLDKGLVDFGLLVGPVDVSKYDFMQLPMTDAWGVLMKADSPLAEKKCVSAEDLWDKPLIVSHQASVSDDLLSWLKAEPAKLNIAVTYDLIYNASYFVKKDMGYAITLNSVVSQTDDNGLCFRPLSPPLEAGLCIVWKKYQIFSKASQKFLTQLQRELHTDNGQTM